MGERWRALDKEEKYYAVMITVCSVIVLISVFLLCYAVANGAAEVKKNKEYLAEATEWQYIMDNTDCAGQAVYYKNSDGEWVFKGCCEYMTHRQEADGTVWYDIKFKYPITWNDNEDKVSNVSEEAGKVKIDSIPGPVLQEAEDGEAD